MLVGGVPAHGKGVGLSRFSGSPPTQTIPWYCELYVYLSLKIVFHVEKFTIKNGEMLNPLNPKQACVSVWAASQRLVLLFLFVLLHSNKSLI